MFIVPIVASGAMPWAKPPAVEPDPIDDLVATIAVVLLFWVVPLMLIYLDGFGFFEPTPKPHVKQTVVVTGATAGIGLDLVKTLAARGDKVFALVRKRSASWSGVDEISNVVGDVTIIEGVDVAKDGVGSVLARSALAGETIDVLINNAGSLAGGASQKGGFAQFAEYKLETITMDAMRNGYEVNTLGPLRVTKALMGQLATPGGKVVVINTGLGSIGDNGSGGNYAYRTSKAAANMVTKCLAADLKGKGVAVCAVAPGFVATNFGGEVSVMQKMGAAPVGQATGGILATIDAMSLANTGRFIMVPTNGAPPKPFPW
jgi:tubulin alpha